VPDPTPLSDEDIKLLRQFRKLAGGAVADPGFTVGQALGQLGLSERSLHRKFKQLTGLTPAAYLRELRLERARELLLAGKAASVEAVALAVGFEDPYYFARIFHKRYGQRASDLLSH
jgi:transcriptional regulator GlxA family with amidase domain